MTLETKQTRNQISLLPPKQSSVHAQWLSLVQIFATPWTTARQAPLSMGYSRQEYWSGLPFHSPGGRLGPGMEPASPLLQTDSLPLSHLGSEAIVNTFKDNFSVSVLSVKTRVMLSTS